MKINNEQLIYIRGIQKSMLSMKKELTKLGVFSYQKCKIIVVNNTDVHYFHVEVSIHSNGYPEHDYYIGEDRIRNDFEIGEIDRQSQIEHEVFCEIRTKTSIMWVTVQARAIEYHDTHFVNTYIMKDITGNEGDILVLTVTIEGGKMKVASHTESMNFLF